MVMISSCMGRGSGTGNREPVAEKGDGKLYAVRRFVLVADGAGGPPGKQVRQHVRCGVTLALRPGSFHRAPNRLARVSERASRSSGDAPVDVRGNQAETTRNIRLLR